MASIRFRTYGENKENTPVYIRFSNGRSCNFEIKSGIIIPNSDFLKDGKTRRVASFKDQLKIQERLNQLESLVSSRLIQTTEYTRDWLESVVNEFNGVKQKFHVPTLIELIDKYCEHIENSATDQVRQNTIKTYKVSKMRLEKFQVNTGKVYSIDQVNIQFKTDFIKWARKVENYQTSTLLKSIKQFKTVCKYAKRIGFEVDNSFINDSESNESRNGKKELKKPIFLSIDEINKISKFSGQDYLMNARDWLIISCWTGCRVSDLMKLTTDNILLTINGEKTIQYTQQKTGKTVNTPYHPQVDKIIKERGGFPRPISDQKYNLFIKEVCKQSGIDQITLGSRNNPTTNRKETGEFPKYELISTHIGRRSFASNHYGKFPIEILMLVTGHATVRQFLEYVGENPDLHITTLNQYYRDQVESVTNLVSEK